jgi:invasion protein IalB
MSAMTDRHPRPLEPRRCARPAVSFVTGILWLAVPAAAQTALEAGRYGDWILSVAPGESKICYAATQPKAKEPATANRAKVLLYISAWPKDGVKSEVSFKLGYPIKTGSEVTVLVGKDTFSLFPKEDRAFVDDPTEELKLIEAMKKGSKLLVKATSERGTATTDTYSLAGLSQALQALATSCP